MFVEYAKSEPEDILIRITVHNRGAAPASIRVLPTLWFRNTWSWNTSAPPKPVLAVSPDAPNAVRAEHAELGTFLLACDRHVPLLFTENETNDERVFGRPNMQPYVKDGIGRYIVDGERDAVNPAGRGTKVRGDYALTIAGHGAIMCSFTNTFTATTAQGSVRRTKRAGPV